MPTATKQEIGVMIRAARERAGLSQVQLAAALGMAQPEVSRWERGSVAPGPRNRQRIAEAVGDPDLFEESG